jgi:hypothetical protein
MQTLAGLALDTRQGSPANVTPGVPSRGGLMAIQHLLNTFVVLNIFHFLALMALAHLDRRRKAAVTSAASMHDEIVQDDLYEEHTGSPKTGDYVEDSGGAESPIRLSLSAREALPSVTLPQQTHPLLMTNIDRSSFVETPLETNPRLQITPSDPPKSKQERRGELFAGLSAALIVFAWALFLVTAWLRLRSKAERGGSATGINRP